MSRRGLIDSLSTLVQVRSVEVERMEADLARQEATRRRYQASVDRLTALAESSGASGTATAARLTPALALNCGQYKEAVFALADSHRTDLQLHEANMAASQRHLAAAWTRRELLGKVLEQHQGVLSREQDRAVRKREDDIATQAWLAGQE